MVLEVESDKVRAVLQSVPARVGAGRGGRRRQGDGDRGLDRVIHGQDQAGAPDCHLVLRQGELVIQSFVERASPGAGGGGALAVDGAWSGRIRADCDVGIHGAHAGVVQDEVRVVVVERAFVLRGNKEMRMKKK